jgi:hypothetical protein
MGEVFVLHPVLNKNLSQDFENSSSIFPESPRKQTGQTGEKKWFLKFGRAVLEG